MSLVKSLCFLALTTFAAAAPTVTIDQGTVKGKADDGVVSFLSIPYAAPPTGDLRWRPPQEPLSWQGERDGTYYREICYGNDQAAILPLSSIPQQSEDCLTLNVHLHEKHYNNFQKTGALQPVYVFIHGGSLDGGNSAEAVYDGRTYLRELNEDKLDQSHLFVSFNYRLATFGFFSSYDTVDPVTNATGNFGLLDTIKALQWIQKNIHMFGGDAKRVTLSGHSAGSILANTLQFSPLANGLFSQVALFSGNVDTANFLSLEQSKAKTYDVLLAATNCDGIECLRGLDAQKILDVYLANPGTNMIIDGYALQANPSKLQREGSFHKVPVFTGNVVDEGTPFVNAEITTEAQLVEFLRALLPSKVDELMTIYTENRFGSYQQAAAAALGDSWFRCPTQNFAQTASNYNPVYLYMIRSTYKALSLFQPGFGVFHLSDMIMLFQSPKYTLLNVLLDFGNKDLAEDYAKMLASFVTTGNPDIGDLNERDLTFPTYSSVKQFQHLSMDAGWFAAKYKIEKSDKFGPDCGIWESAYVEKASV